VAPDGNDANDGLSTATAFHTVQHCASVANPGDACFLRAGTYRETVTPARSGTSGAPILFASCPGVEAIVSGADPVTGWS
jgi:hypothetical protein